MLASAARSPRDKSLVPLAGYLRELAFLARTAGTIRTAIGRSGASSVR